MGFFVVVGFLVLGNRGCFTSNAQLKGLKGDVPSKVTFGLEIICSYLLYTIVVD